MTDTYGMISKCVVVGIGYKARQGKDTLAQMLLERLPNSMIMHFADALKQRAREFYDWKPENKNETAWSLKQRHPELWPSYWPEVTEDDPRTFLQYYGTDVVRNTQGQDWWVRILAFDVKEEVANNGTEIIIIPDMRYFNELLFCRINGVTVRVTGRPECGERSGSHPSESELSRFHDMFDYTVSNHSTLDDLGLLADYLAREIGKVHGKKQEWEKNK